MSMSQIGFYESNQLILICLLEELDCGKHETFRENQKKASAYIINRLRQYSLIGSRGNCADEERSEMKACKYIWLVSRSVRRMSNNQ